MSNHIKQYNQIKAKYKDALLLFRIGDFYETFHDDAAAAAKVLGHLHTETKNDEGQITGLRIPHYALDTALRNLVRAGFKVGICDQLEVPKTSTGQVKRGITDLL